MEGEQRMSETCMVCQRIEKIKRGENPYFVRELETGYVVIGDSITNPATSLDCHGLIPKHDSNIWYTPFFFRQEWNLRRALAQFEILLKPCYEVIREELTTEIAPSAIAQPSFEETASGQLSLF